MTGLATQLRFGLARWLLKAGGLGVVPTWVNASFIEPSFRSLVREGYAKNGAVMACVEALTFAFPAAPLRIYDREGDDARMVGHHPLRRLLARPNPRMGEAQLQQLTIAYMAIGGNAYWHKVRGGTRKVVELWPYHAGQIRPVPGGDEWITQYAFDDGSSTPTPIPAEDIVHFQWPTPDPNQPWQALPPLAAAAREVDTDNEVGRYLFALLKNDAIPRIALKMPPGASLKDGEVRRMRDQWRERYGGDNRGGPAILEEGAEIQRIGLDLAELAFDALHRIPETRIAAVLRVPPILAGLAAGLERSTFANYQEARRAFTEDTLAPLWHLNGSTVAAQLGPEFGAADVRHDLSRVGALQESLNDRHKRAYDGYARGVLTRNEARRYIGFADVGGGDSFYEPPARQQLAAESAPKGLLAPAPAKALPASARQTKATVAAIEGRVARAVGRYLAGQYALAADAVRDLAKADPILDPAVAEQLGLDLGDLARQTMRRFYPLLLQRAFDDAGGALDVDLAFDLDNLRVQETLEDLATRVARISDTTRADIRALIGRQVAEGWSVGQVAEAIAALGDDHSAARAAVIARTESASAYARGSILAWRESGVVAAVEWDATLDDTTATVCKTLHGTRAPLGGAFADGTRFPPQHPNCRCALIPIVE